MIFKKPTKYYSKICQRLSKVVSPIKRSIQEWKELPEKFELIEKDFQINKAKANDTLESIIGIDSNLKNLKRKVNQQNDVLIATTCKISSDLKQMREENNQEMHFNSSGLNNIEKILDDGIQKLQFQTRQTEKIYKQGGSLRKTIENTTQKVEKISYCIEGKQEQLKSFIQKNLKGSLRQHEIAISQMDDRIGKIQNQLSILNKTMIKLLESQSKTTQVFIDWPNLRETALRDMGLKINPKILYSYLQKKYSPSKLDIYAFLTRSDDEKSLKQAGFQVFLCPSNVDPFMHRRAKSIVAHRQHELDKIVVVAGDNAYMGLLIDVHDDFRIPTHVLFLHKNQIGNDLKDVVQETEEIDINYISECGTSLTLPVRRFTTSSFSKKQEKVTGVRQLKISR